MPSLFTLDNFLGLKSLLQAGELYLHIRNPVFGVRDTGISYRNINHWDSEGILTLQRETERKWRTFSFVDFVWIKVVEQLRKLGYPLDHIRSVKEELMFHFRGDQVMELFKDNKEFWKQAKGRLSKEDFEDLKLRYERFSADISKIEDFDEVMEVMDAKLGPMVITFTMLQYLITVSLESKVPVSLLVFDDGSVIPEVHHPSFEMPEELRRKRAFGTYISVSITHVIREFLSDESQTFKLAELQILGKNERKLLEIIQSGEYESMTVEFQDGEMNSITLVKSENTRKSIAEIISENRYSRIEIKNHKGMITTIQNTVKKFMNEL